MLLTLMLSVASAVPPLGVGTVEISETASGLFGLVSAGYAGGAPVVATTGGELLAIGAEGQAVPWGRVAPVADDPAGRSGGTAVHGLAVDPFYATNGRVVVAWVEGGALGKVGVFRAAPGAKAGEGALEAGPVVFEAPGAGSVVVGFSGDGALFVATDAAGGGRVHRVDLDAGGAELWFEGLRAPSGLAATSEGALLVTDVGESWQEVHVVARGGHGGWPHADGRACLVEEGCAPEHTRPLWAYDARDGAAIRGGAYATRGPAAGRLVFADATTGALWALGLVDGVARVEALGHWRLGDVQVVPGPDGDVVVVDREVGRLLRLVPPSPAADRFKAEPSAWDALRGVSAEARRRR